MSESAKQDTTKAPAESAETESAATRGEAQSAEAPEHEEAPVPVEAGVPVETGVHAAADAVAEDSAKPDLDETKRKFREALDRKRQVHTDGQGTGGRDGAKVSGAHGPAASRRNFRRKSG